MDDMERIKIKEKKKIRKSTRTSIVKNFKKKLDCQDWIGNKN